MSKNKKNKDNKLTSKALKAELARYFLAHKGKALNARELINKLKVKNNKDSLEYALSRLLEEGLITGAKNDKYILADGQKAASKKAHSRDKPKSNSGKVYEGLVDMTKSGAGYLVCDDLKEDVYIPARFMNGALNGDRVQFVVRPMANRRRPEGEIKKIVNRSTETFIGSLHKHGKRYVVSPDGLYNDFDIFIKHEDINDANHGDKVVVKITTWPGKRRVNAEGIITEVFGKSGSSDIEMKTILVNQGFELDFPETVKKESEAISSDIPDKEIAARRDMRSVTTFTIDPETAKDFDDALSIRKLDSGNWEIGVHIADVSYYVKLGTALDKDAYKRSTSVYLVDRVLPMLPERLSNELCSLRPNEDKLTYSAVFELDDKGKVKNRWFGRTVIHSDRRFTYEQAQENINKGEGDFYEELRLLNQLAKVMRKDRFKKGSIDFSMDEVQFRLDDEGRPIDVYIKERIDTHMLIEEFMLLANKEVSHFMAHKEQPAIPFIYRIHDKPDQSKVSDFAAFASELGIKMNVSTPRQIAMSFNNLSKMSQKNELYKLLEPLAIRTMSKAEYSAENIGHYGLGFEYYSHFTSPIRRYSDVIAHRILEANLKGQYRMPLDELETMCKHISAQERKAMDAERESVKYKQVEFIEQFIGSEFEGIVSGMIDRGIFVELKANKCEGMISFDRMSEPYHIEDSKLKARGLVTGHVIKMGDSIQVRILSTDLSKRQIEMEILSPGNK